MGLFSFLRAPVIDEGVWKFQSVRRVSSSETHAPQKRPPLRQRMIFNRKSASRTRLVWEALFGFYASANARIPFSSVISILPRESRTMPSSEK